MNQCWMAFDWRSWVGIQAGWKPALGGVLLLASLAPGAAWGHGPQIQITNTQGKIVTRDLITDSPFTPLTPPRSVYVMPIMEWQGSWYARPNLSERPIIGGPQFYSGPGIAYGSQTATPDPFAPGENFSLEFGDLLRQWDGDAFVPAGETQIRAFRGSPTNMTAMATTSDNAPYASLEFPAIEADYSSDAHASARFQFLPNGIDPGGGPDDGIYLLSLSLSTTQPGIEPSDPFYFVLTKNASRHETMAAVTALGFSPSLVQHLGTVVPEPSSLALALLGAGGLAFLLARRDVTR